MMTADSQSSSQFGDVGKYREIDLITPTEHEARLSTRNTEDGLVVLADQLLSITKSRNIILKLGREGVFIHNGRFWLMG